MTQDTPIPKKLNLMGQAQGGGRTQLDNDLLFMQTFKGREEKANIVAGRQ